MISRKRFIMSLGIPKINNTLLRIPFRGNYTQASVITSKQPENVMSVYGDDEIRTKPAQLSLFAMHDFHGQNIRMERAYTAATQFDRGVLARGNEIFDKDKPIDSFKVASGDMFLGENEKELRAVNEFLNIAGVMATALGNHECDAEKDLFANIVGNRKYRFLGSNKHPEENSKINSLLSDSFVVESNGNRYGFIGILPLDMDKHLKHPEEVEDLHISDLNGTVKDLQKEIDKIKKYGVNKIILLSHAGLENEKYIAEHVSDIDIILGAHTHNLLTEVKKGENLLLSPKNEPVLIMQVGRDGEHIGIPNVVFDEAGKITKIQYNVLNTDEFARSMIAKNAIEGVLGKAEVVGKLGYVEAPPNDIYANENPHCTFIADCMKNELGTDIAVINSANLRGRFYPGVIDTRELHLISPFGNKMVVIKATEEEIVNGIKNCVKASMTDPKHRPGILQVSGLMYEFSKSTGNLTSMSFVDNDKNVHPIDVNNPRKDKFYTIALDDFCAIVENNGMGLKHRYDDAIAIYDYDKDKLAADYLKKQTTPQVIKSDGRIKVVD